MRLKSLSLALLAITLAGCDPPPIAEMAACTSARRTLYDLTLLGSYLPAEGAPAASVLVKPLVWQGLDNRSREIFGTWASRCLAQGEPVWVREFGTMKMLARYSEKSGFVVEQ